MKISAKIFKLNIGLMILVLCCVFVGCGETQSTTNVEQISEVQAEKTEKMQYDAIDVSAIVVSTNLTKKTVTLFNQHQKKNYTLSYDGTSIICDKYGSSLVMDQISNGDIVDVTFEKEKKLLCSMFKSAEAWVYDEINDFEINSLTKSMKINGGDYHLTDALKIFSEGKEAQLIDINSCDVLKISGNDHEVYSIIIEQGHGYLRLKGHDYFEGGWIEIGSRIIKNVTKEMLIPVPVGEYEVKLTNGVYEGDRKVKINKNQETEMDVSDMVMIEEDTEGTLILVLNPAGAMVYLDGKEVDISKPIKTQYGVHQLIAKAEGYKSLTQYIKVGQESATLEIELEKTKSLTEIDSEKPAVSPVVEETVITEAVTPGNLQDYRVNIVAPEETEVYLDGLYIGVTPASFVKSEGIKVVTLRKEGFVTRSYTITIDGIEKDESFSFSDLEKEEENAESP